MYWHSAPRPELPPDGSGSLPPGQTACGPQRCQDHRSFRKAQCLFSERSWSAGPASIFPPVSARLPEFPLRSPGVPPYRKYGRSADCRMDVLLPHRFSLPLPHLTHSRRDRKQSRSEMPQGRRFLRSLPPPEAPDFFPVLLLSFLLL